jgi:hypothetical protein
VLVTVEIIGPAKQADSVHKVHGYLALAESYRANRPEAKQNLETILEYVPRPRRGIFLNNYKTGTGAGVLYRC